MLHRTSTCEGEVISTCVVGSLHGVEITTSKSALCSRGSLARAPGTHANASRPRNDSNVPTGLEAASVPASTACASLDTVRRARSADCRKRPYNDDLGTWPCVDSAHMSAKSSTNCKGVRCKARPEALRRVSMAPSTSAWVTEKFTNSALTVTSTRLKVTCISEELTSSFSSSLGRLKPCEAAYAPSFVMKDHVFESMLLRLCDLWTISSEAREPGRMLSAPSSPFSVPTLCGCCSACEEGDGDGAEAACLEARQDATAPPTDAISPRSASACVPARCTRSSFIALSTRMSH
mmetsp:Transcript_9365/g.38418  ORF Transcript_9365/g.38418 Transcript_9365/m.38418 type:complete len:292 (-) Transcript_9365:833-1708(-)